MNNLETYLYSKKQYNILKLLSNNVIVIEPSKKHLFTVIILHSMYHDYTEFMSILNNKLNNNIKFIFPDSPLRDINWPNGTEYNVKSWYNYFTNYSGTDKFDKIDIEQFNDMTIWIKTIIDNEIKNLKNPKNIILVGSSQGGALALNIALTYNEILGGVICLRSCLLNYTPVKIEMNELPIYLFVAEKDNIYSSKLTGKAFKRLTDKNYKVIMHIEKNLNHTDNNINESIFLKKSILQIFNLNLI